MATGISEELDGLDLDIVRVLQTDVRAPYAQVARQVGVDDTTVRRRIDRLLREGLLNLYAVVDPRGTGTAAHALVMVDVLPGLVEDVAEEFKADDRVVYVGVGSGQPGLWLSVVYGANHELYEFLHAKLAKIEGVRGYEAQPILSVLKRRSGWSPGING